MQEEGVVRYEDNGAVKKAEGQLGLEPVRRFPHHINEDKS